MAISLYYHDQYSKQLDNFDPEAKPSPFATYCPGRYPNFKMHARRGDAKNALANQYYGILYELENGKWTERARKVPHERCDECSVPLTFTDQHGRLRNEGQAVWDKRNGPLKLIWTCIQCKQRLSQ